MADVVCGEDCVDVLRGEGVGWYCGESCGMDDGGIVRRDYVLYTGARRAPGAGDVK